MTSSHIPYANLYKTEHEKEAAALADMENWLEPRQLQALNDAARNPDVTYAHFAFYAEFAGVRGYPVLVFWNHYRNVHDFHIQDYVERAL